MLERPLPGGALTPADPLSRARVRRRPPRRRRAAARDPCVRAPPRCRSRCRPRTGAVAAIASPTLSAVRPPLRISGTRERRARSELPVERLARAAAHAAPCRGARERASSRWKSTWKRSRSRTSPAPATWAALITRAPVRRRTSPQKAGPSSPCSCTSVEPQLLARGDDLLQRRVDEHPAQLDAAAQARGDHAVPPSASSGAGCPRRRSSRAPTPRARPPARRRRGS